MLLNCQVIKKTALFISAACIFTNVAQAATSRDGNIPAMLLTSASKAIVNLDQVMSDVKAKSHIPVLFPAQVPVSKVNQKYYASSVVGPEGNNYVINIGTKPNCNGMKYCNIASISGTLGQRPQIYATLHGPDLTETMELVNDYRGYFTPSHAEADFWSSMIEWRMDSVLYNITWKVAPIEEKQMMVALANSAIQAGSR